MQYAGSQINERWAIIPLCWHHHLDKGLNKRINEFLALQRASDQELAKYPKASFARQRDYLKTIYGDKIQP